MKKILFLILLSGLFAVSLFGQSAYKLATYSNGYTWTKSNAQIGAALNEYFNESLSGDYQFTEAMIDDNDPSNLDSIAYLLITATGTKGNGCITFGITLKKVFSETIDGAIDYEIKDTAALRLASGLEEIGWKCTSTSTQCGGCVKIRQNGVVVACHCYANTSTYCNFETTGGGGTNLPSWIIQLVIALIGLF
ncbi:MAG TPA: hypothetical protein VFV31_09590 [Chitinophagaceae bacterium]|nr:hypothetical protein [Chitinophagaceae bacterium]